MLKADFEDISHKLGDKFSKERHGFKCLPKWLSSNKQETSTRKAMERRELLYIVDRYVY